MKTIISTALLLVMIMFGKYAKSQVQGPLSSSSSENQPLSSCTPCSGGMWQNDQNVFSQNGQFASVQLQNYLNCAATFCYWSRYLHTTNYNFNIPANAVIKGIEVSVTGNASNSSAVIDSTVKLGIANTLIGTNHNQTTPWTTTTDTRTYGNATDLWGTNLQPADINSSNFGLFYKVYNTTLSATNMLVDYISITVYYSITTGIILSQTATQNQASVYACNGELTVACYNATSYTVSVFDALGKNISQVKPQTEVYKTTTAELPAGIYFVKVESQSGSITKKIIIN